MEAEGNLCRIGANAISALAAEESYGCLGPVQRAHVIGREHDEPHPTRPGWRIVRAVDVVPLCRAHHIAYDGRALDLLPYLTVEEQARAVLLSDGLVSALVRLSGGGGRLAL